MCIVTNISTMFYFFVMAEEQSTVEEASVLFVGSRNAVSKHLSPMSCKNPGIVPFRHCLRPLSYILI